MTRQNKEQIAKQDQILQNFLIKINDILENGTIDEIDFITNSHALFVNTLVKLKKNEKEVKMTRLNLFFLILYHVMLLYGIYKNLKKAQTKQQRLTIIFANGIMLLILAAAGLYK